MEHEKRLRRESRRVIISEILMVLTVILTVVILAFVVSGYWLSADFKVERQGLLQVSSVPTGADVAIDGETAWLQRTNMSKVLSTGEHTIRLSKEGYDAWEKTIDMKEGLLYRIGYPRLFLNERDKEVVYTGEAVNTGDAGAGAEMTFATVSPDRNLLVIMNRTTKWKLINLENEKLDVKTLDISKIFHAGEERAVVSEGRFTGEIVGANWDRDSERILIEVKSTTGREWVILNVKNLAASVNLSREFNVDFQRIEILDNSASNLLAVISGNLHKIDVSGRAVSAVLVPNVYDFDHRNSTVVFAAKTPKEMEEGSADDFPGLTEVKEHYVGVFELGNTKITPVMFLDEKAEVAISRFYDDDYLSIVAAGRIGVYKKENYQEFFEEELEFAPEEIKVSYGGEFIVLSRGEKIATVDMEAVSLVNWETGATEFAWLDNSMIYVINKENELFVYDFDGLNRRALATEVLAGFPVTITNDKWLYYFNTEGDLVREWLVKR